MIENSTPNTFDRNCVFAKHFMLKHLLICCVGVQRPQSCNLYQRPERHIPDGKDRTPSRASDHLPDWTQHQKPFCLSRKSRSEMMFSRRKSDTHFPQVLGIKLSFCLQDIVTWYNVIRAARYSYLKTAYPTGSDKEVRLFFKNSPKTFTQRLPLTLLVLWRLLCFGVFFVLWVKNEKLFQCCVFFSWYQR